MRKRDRHCVVLAGGLGTRLEPVTGGLIPKAMAPVNGKPFLFYKIQELIALGITDITLLVGKHGEQINEYIADFHDERTTIQCVPDGPSLLGTGGSIRQALPFIPDYFWVTYGDTLVSANLASAEQRMADLNCTGIMTVLHNFNLLQPSNTTVVNEIVTHYSKSELSMNFEWIDFGLLYLSSHHFLEPELPQTFDLSSVVLGLIQKQLLLAWEVNERFWDIGNPQALLETENEIRRRSR